MIYLKGVNKFYPGGVTAVKDAEILVEEGSTMALLGEEGSGKSTVIRLINRLEEPSSGQIQMGGVDIARVNAREHRAKMGFVVSGAGLLRHVTLRGNVALAPRLKALPADKREEEIDRILGVVGLDAATAAKRPMFVGVVERLRAAIARALAGRPPIILLDEPFWGLDRITRDMMRRELLRIRLLSRDTTFVLATRDVVESVKLSDTVVLMKDGQIVESGDTRAFMENPRSKYGQTLVKSHKFQIQLEAISLGEMMIRDPLFITTSQSGLPVSRAVYLMQKNRVGSILVTDENRILKGIIDMEDVQEGNPERRLGDAIRGDLASLRTTDSFSDAMTFFAEREEEFLPVVDGKGRLQGLITRKSVSKHLEKIL